METEVFRFAVRRRSKSNQIEHFRRGDYPTGTMEDGPNEVQKDWSGYSCPMCHAIFRLRSDSEGVMAECPSCGEMVGVRLSQASGGAAAAAARPKVQVGMNLAGELPARKVKEEDSQQVEVAAARSARQSFRNADVIVNRGVGQEFRKADVVVNRDESEESSAMKSSGTERTGRRRKRRRKVVKSRGRSESFDWDSESTRESAGSGRRSSLKIVLFGGLVAVVLIAGVMILFLVDLDKGKEGSSFEDALLSREGIVVGTDDEEGVFVKELRTADIDAEVAAMTEAVERFLGATTVDELLAVTLRDRYQQDRIRDYYQTRELTPKVAKLVAAGGRIVKNGDLWATDVVFSDNSRRPITVQRGENGYRVDWESWVGYSEMTWEEIREARPMKPVLFRVLCSRVQYYNYGFVDEREWLSFRLQSPDRKQTLYGYAARRSEVEKRLVQYGDKEGKPRAFIVKIRFAEDSGPDQVIIDEVLSAGWSAVGNKFGFSDSPPNPE